MIAVPQATACWRRRWRPDLGWCAEVSDGDGKWFWPDCGWSCRLCGECLGCERKRAIVDGELDHELVCRVSGGAHQPIEGEQ